MTFHVRGRAAMTAPVTVEPIVKSRTRMARSLTSRIERLQRTYEIRSNGCRHPEPAALDSRPLVSDWIVHGARNADDPVRVRPNH
jgi:hypothetical protein